MHIFQLVDIDVMATVAGHFLEYHSFTINMISLKNVMHYYK